MLGGKPQPMKSNARISKLTATVDLIGPPEQLRLNLQRLLWKEDKNLTGEFNHQSCTTSLESFVKICQP
jgi:hypothetical protein